MCGRYVFVSEPNELKEEFPDLEIQENWTRGVNISPGQKILILGQNQNGFYSNQFLWGLVPSWSKDKKAMYKMINARSETIIEKPSFKKPFLKQRCLVPFNAYYEWKAEGKKKVPHLFQFNTKVNFFAGIYDIWKSENELIYTCSLITRQAVQEMLEIHDRMPIVLNPQNGKHYLSDKWGGEDLLNFINNCYEIPNRVESITQINEELVNQKLFNEGS
jgi:putative SOS response-associated peptidase YedK